MASILGGLAGLASGLIQRASGLFSAAVPFGAPDHSRPNIPKISWSSDQPPPPPQKLSFDPAYHGHTFRSFSPLSPKEWSVEQMRNAIALHDQGYFLESSLFSRALSKYAPVVAALGQQVAPILSLPRHIHCGTKGVARIAGAEVEEILAPSEGLMPSPYFPPTLIGAMAIDLANMNFSVLQHVYGDPDPVTGVRPIYTRRWPIWATQFYEYRKTFVAITTDGPVDIISGDGKFTLVADEEFPHHNSAVRALGPEVMDGVLAKQARSNYIDKYGNPKWIGVMPENVAVHGPEGDAFFEALQTIQEPEGYGALPHGSDLQVREMSGSQSDVFQAALDCVWAYVAAIYLGSDGTMSKGTGVYSAPVFAGVRRDLILRRLVAIVRAINSGIIAPYLAFNYGQSIIEAKRRGIWTYPVLDIPLPDPEADARVNSYAEHVLKRAEIIEKERSVGIEITQERVDALSVALDLDTVPLAQVAPTGAQSYEYDQHNGVITINQRLEELGKPADTTGRGDMTIPEYQAKLEAEKAKAQQQPTPPPTAGGPKPEPPEGAPGKPPAMPTMPEMPGASSLAVLNAAGDWDESKHPRAADGKFGSGGGGATKAAPKASKAKSPAKASPKAKSAPAKATPKAKPGKESFSRGKAGQRAVRQTESAKFADEMATHVGDEIARGNAAEKHDLAAKSHADAAKAARNEDLKRAHERQAKLHRSLAKDHRWEIARLRDKDSHEQDHELGSAREAVFNNPHGTVIEGHLVVDPSVKKEHQHVVDAVKAELSRVPESLQKALADRGVISVCADSVVDVYPGLAKKRPRGYPKGKTYKHCGGVFVPKDRKSVIASSDRFSKAPATALHELGHALDFNASSLNFSQQKWFVDAYDKAVSSGALLAWKGDAAEYYMQPGAAGRQEFFAEVFGHAMYGDGYYHKQLNKHFPGLVNKMAKHIAADYNVQSKAGTGKPPLPKLRPKPLRVGKGGHVGAVESDYSKKQTRKILNAINEHPILNAALQVHPISAIRVDGPLRSKDGKRSNDGSSGTYLHKSPPPDEEKLALSLVHLNLTNKKAKDNFEHEDLRPGKTHSISSTGKTPEERAVMTMTHELGHHLQFASDSYDEAKRIFANKPKSITKYGSKTSREYFAECFSAYVHHHDTLRAHDPRGHAMIESALKKSNIL